MSTEHAVAACRRAVGAEGFCFAPGERMRAWLEAGGPLANWDSFADSWNRLEPDPYLAARGRQRKRRFGVWAADARGVLTRAPHQPHYQALAYNALQGGIERWFEPIDPVVGNSQALRAILTFATSFFGGLVQPRQCWRIEAHQFRIEATPGFHGEPTPEGVHRDGVDFVLVLLVRRRNLGSGTTTIHAPDGSPLGAFTLTDAFDAALLDDRRVFHGVTPVHPIDASLPACRDVLVVTLRGVPEGTLD